MKKNKLIFNKNEIIKILGNNYQDLANIVSDKFGIINALMERFELSQYDLYMFQCLSANAKDLFALDREVSSGGLGVSQNKEDALIGSLAEAIERYAMSFIPQKELIFANLKDLDNKHTFKEFYTYTAEQYKFTNFANPYKDCIHWTKILNVSDKSWKYWPASLIYLPFNASLPVAENTSTGMAAGKCIQDCIISGLLELIERDALMINFYQELNPCQIDISTITGKNKELLQKIQKNYNVRIYKLYSDINVPIFYSLIWTKNNYHYGIGASANLDSDIALEKSLKECLFTYFYSQNIMKSRVNNPNDIKALYEHFLYYQGKNFAKLLTEGKKIEYVSIKISYKQLLKDLKKQGIEVYYKELTTTDIKKTKIKVVKVIAPGLIDLNKSHVLPRLACPRIWNVPQKLGLKVKKNISVNPHPFP